MEIFELKKDEIHTLIRDLIRAQINFSRERRKRVTLKRNIYYFILFTYLFIYFILNVFFLFIYFILNVFE